MSAKTRPRADAFVDRDGRRWERGVKGRYFHLLTAPSGDQYWVDSSYGNLVAEFGPLTAA